MKNLFCLFLLILSYCPVYGGSYGWDTWILPAPYSESRGKTRGIFIPMELNPAARAFFERLEENGYVYSDRTKKYIFSRMCERNPHFPATLGSLDYPRSVSAFSQKIGFLLRKTPDPDLHPVIAFLDCDRKYGESKLIYDVMNDYHGLQDLLPRLFHGARWGLETAKGSNKRVYDKAIFSDVLSEKAERKLHRNFAVERFDYVKDGCIKQAWALYYIGRTSDLFRLLRENDKWKEDKLFRMLCEEYGWGFLDTLRLAFSVEDLIRKGVLNSEEVGIETTSKGLSQLILEADDGNAHAQYLLGRFYKDFGIRASIAMAYIVLAKRNNHWVACKEMKPFLESFMVNLTREGGVTQEILDIWGLAIED